MILLFESKADQLKLVNFAGQQLADEFFKLKQRMKSPYNDIYYWLKKSPEELQEYINSLHSTQTQSEKRNSAKEGADLIADENGWKVYEILTYPASVYYDKNTQWCIAGSKRWNNGEQGEEYFDQYTLEWGVRFFFFIKSNNEKYAVALYPSGKTEVFNSVDDAVDGLPKDCPYIKELDTAYNIDNNKYTTTEAEDDTLIYTSKSKVNDYVRENIMFVIIDDDVDTIPEEEFRECEYLKKVVFGKNVSEIGPKAFMNCKMLYKIDFSKCEDLEYIGEYAFYGTGIFSVRLPDTLNYVDECAFCDCKDLQEALLPKDLPVISKGLFDYCSSLDYVRMPLNVKRIENSAFYKTSLSEIEFPETLTTIGNFAFFGTNLKRVVLPDSMHYLNRYCFANCDSLSDVVIPKIPTSKELIICENAFDNTLALERINEEIKDNIFITIEEDDF